MAVGSRDWTRSLYETLDGDYTTAAELREASIAGDLARWTQALTSLVTRSLRELGLEVAARGHRCTGLPIKREEYLALDVTAFRGVERGWRFPVAVCELENSGSDAVVAYALWKVLCIRDTLRVVFCYRSPRSDARRLIRLLTDGIDGAMAHPDRERLGGDTLVFIGSRSESHTFPYGFFQAWRLNRNLGRFETFGWQE
ncbi:MAG: hypothetical protein F4Z28_08610 [Gammaproteobacteria bacterium]|nr:hypothetical protein [Gammaproteobacteria bacterium]